MEKIQTSTTHRNKCASVPDRCQERGGGIAGGGGGGSTTNNTETPPSTDATTGVSGSPKRHQQANNETYGDTSEKP